MLTFLSLQRMKEAEPCAMICTLGSFCPRMSAKIRVLVVLFPLQPEHVPFNGTSDQTRTSINQLISQESKLNMLAKRRIDTFSLVAVTFLFYNLLKCFANLTLIARTLFLNKEVVLHFVN